ncbi:MAG: response regulator transcription factor [Acidobacteriaceae bacterium]|nr:response regulator transcription factor [Acidobacteriaceae bacterium]
MRASVAVSKMPMVKPRVLIADDHALIVEGFRSVLSSHFEIVGVVQEGHSLITEAVKLRPDLMLLDIGMPLLNGIDAARQVLQILPSTKVVFVTQQTDRRYVQAAFRAGASGYILKESAIAELVPALRQVLEGRFYITPLLRRNISDTALKSSVNPSELFADTLTVRQREVLQLVAEGKAAKEIAALLNISLKTVEYHKAGIMEALGVRSTAGLTRYAIEHGMITPHSVDK